MSRTVDRALLHLVFVGIVVSTVRCGSSVTCPDTAATVTYDDVAPIFKAECTGCHATTRTGSKRHGAPDDSNYDTYADAAKDARRGADTVISGSMPYGNTIRDADACAIKNWSDQGAVR